MALMHAKREGKRFLNPVPTSIGDFSIMLKIGPEFFFGGAERSPKTPPGPFRTDKNAFATAPASGLRVTWFGHSASLLEIDGVRILIDPVWDERAAPVQWMGPKRFFPPTIALEELPPIDVVLISHDHLITWVKAPSVSLHAWRVSRMRAGSRPSAWARSLQALVSPPICAPNSTGPTRSTSVR